MSTTIYGSTTAQPFERRRQFVVVTSQRTGSTLLIRSLDSAHQVFCAGELFHNGPNVYHREFQFPFQFLGSKRLGRLINILGSRPRVQKHLQEFYANAGAEAAAIGFKVMASQIRTFPTIMPVLRELGVDFLYLYREDTFAAALSYYKARVSGVYHSDRVDPTKDRPPIVVEEIQFRQFLEECQSDKQQILQLWKAYGGRLLTYEAMVAQWDEFIAAIGEEIGVPGLNVQKTLSKLKSGVDSVRLVNESSLRERFGSEVQ